MAEDVQATLDDMVPALKQLQDRGVFTAEEIHQIVDRRRSSEYDIRRIKDPRKADYLSYIEAEVTLEQLRKLRTKRLQQRQMEENHGKEKEEKEAGEEALKTKLGDVHILKHIHGLWKRTLYKFGKSDVSLYLQYADFCKQVHANGALSRCLAEAVQLFPHEEGLWIEAASHEFFNVGNMQSARILLQQGIRLQEKSQDLWLQLFILELHFAERLKARRTILEGGGEDRKVEEAAIVDKKENDDEKILSDPHKIARLVYQNAVQAVPDEVAFRLKFWDQCRLFSETQNLQKYIVDSIRSDLCKDSPDAWMAWALYQWEHRSANEDKLKAEENAGSGNEENSSDEKPSEGKKRKGDKGDEKESSQKKARLDADEQESNETVLEVLRQATKAIATEEMYLKATRMISRYIASLQEEEQDEDDEEDPEIPAGLQILETLFEEAEKSDFFSEELVTEQALFLSRCGRKEDAAESLRRFAESHPTEDALKIWVNLAELSESGPITVLSKALARTDINHPTYYELLLHLFGVKLQAKSKDLMSFFEKITLLTPGFLPINPIDEPIFGVSHALDACLQFLRYLSEEKKDVVSARKVYRTVTSQSSLGSIFVEFDDASMDAFIEEAARVETGDESLDKSARKKNLVRLYDEAAKLFGNSELGRKYQERKREAQLGNGLSQKQESKSSSQEPFFTVEAVQKRESTSSLHGSFCIVDAVVENPKSSFEDVFQTFQVAHLKHAQVNARKTKKSAPTFDWKSILGLFDSLNDQDKATWCIETPGGEGSKEISPLVFLEPKQSSETGATTRGYCSFLVQHDTAAVEHVLSSIPLTEPLPGIQWHYPTKAFWFFFGRNPPHNADLDGRPEHTDSISTDGTWHYQVSGTKTWFLRPSPQLMEHFKKTPKATKAGAWNENSRVRIDCEEGDILCVNTRLWFHSTIIPPQVVPSVSYARDFYLHEGKEEKSTAEGMNMSNVDGVYATTDIGQGTVLFTENDMPDCELHRSSVDPNCEVVELEDGTSALVSVRDIRAGEFFCVAESDDEACEEEEEEEEVDEDDEE